MRLSFFTLLLFLTSLLPADASAQSRPATEHPLEALPPMSWSCPMHPDVIDGEEGSCPICEMDLEPTRIELAYACPVHGVIHVHEPGVCPIGGRTLQPVTLELVWTCPNHGSVMTSAPGSCPIGGEELEVQWAARAHGDHNPKHGGLFFMAPDNWHHLEGSYPEPGLFRVHVYDDFTQPISASQMKGRAVTREIFDTDTKQTRELAAFPLVPSPNGDYLEARIERLAMPITLSAKVQFEPTGEEARFDFTFSEFSVAPAGGEPALPQSVSGTNAIPTDAEDVVLELAIRQLRLQQLVRRGVLDEVYVPALEAKALALALDEKTAALSGDLRRSVSLEVKRVVRAAWLLDGYGDLGNRAAVEEVYGMFAAAVTNLKRLYDIP
jgi:hypothetical protein